MAEIEPKRNATRIKDKICYPSRPHTSDVIDLDEKSPPDNSCFMKRTDLSQLIVMASSNSRQFDFLSQNSSSISVMFMYLK